MNDSDTRRRLEQIADAGLFEALATAVLREQDARCLRLVHVGVNADGKTVRSPTDAIGYVQEDGLLRMMAVHHTTCRREKLERKWLTDADSDFLKTLIVFKQQRERIPDLRATLILTTNREPPEQLVHRIYAKGSQVGVEIAIYTGSFIAHFLDVERKGQWLRRKFLGVVQSHLSEELLRELCVKSIATVPLPDAESWIERDIDRELATHSRRPVRFIVGESGMGKTVACRKRLQHQISEGGFGLVVTAEALGKSRTLVDAVDTTLRELHPSLAEGEGREAFSLVHENAPLFVVVEGVNRSDHSTHLLEKLASWADDRLEANEDCAWQLLCPVWPRTIATVRESARQLVSESAVGLSCFTELEGIAAVQRRRTEPLGELDAKSVATALGCDPLLIALQGEHDPTPDASSTIQSFVDGSLERLAAAEGRYTAGEYRRTLRTMALELLERRKLEPLFTDVVKWMRDRTNVAEMLRELLRAREGHGSRDLVRSKGLSFGTTASGTIS